MSSQIISALESSPLASSISKASQEDIGKFVYGLEEKQPLSAPLYSTTTPNATYTFGNSHMRFSIPRFGHLKSALFVQMDINCGYNGSDTIGYRYGGMMSLWKSAKLVSSSGREIANLLPEAVWAYMANLPKEEADAIRELTNFYPNSTTTNPGAGDADPYGLRTGSGATGGKWSGFIYLPFACLSSPSTTLDTNFCESVELVLEMRTSATSWMSNNARTGGLAITDPKLLCGFTVFGPKQLKAITARNFKVGSVLTVVTHEDELLNDTEVDISALSDVLSTKEVDITIDSNGLYTKFIIVAQHQDANGLITNLCNIESASLKASGSDIIPSGYNPKVLALMSHQAYSGGHQSNITNTLHDDLFQIPFTTSKVRHSFQNGISLRNLPQLSLKLNIRPTSVDSSEKVQVRVIGVRVKSYSISASSGRINTALNV